MIYEFPPFLLWMLLVACGGATFYYGAIVSGLYKNSMMAHLRKYGEERLAYPICRFLNVLGICCLALALTIPTLFDPTSYTYRLLPPVMFVVLAFLSFGSSLAANQNTTVRQALPLWYHDLLLSTSRQERRHIAFAWLRIPHQLRWRLNADQKAFRAWAELVRLTVIYGAFDPDSPWDLWT
jgi:uncharacterized membrane protein